MGRKKKDELATKILDLEVNAGLDVTATAGMSREQLEERLAELKDMPGAEKPVEATKGGAETPSATDDESNATPAGAEGSGGSEEDPPVKTTKTGLDPQLDPENPGGFTHILFLDQYNCMDFTVRMGRVRAAAVLGKWVEDILTVQVGCWVDPEDPKPPAGMTVRPDPKVAEENRRKAAEPNPLRTRR